MCILLLRQSLYNSGTTATNIDTLEFIDSWPTDGVQLGFVDWNLTLSLHRSDQGLESVL